MPVTRDLFDSRKIQLILNFGLLSFRECFNLVTAPMAKFSRSATVKKNRSEVTSFLGGQMNEALLLENQDRLECSKRWSKLLKHNPGFTRGIEWTQGEGQQWLSDRGALGQKVRSEWLESLSNSN